MKTSTVYSEYHELFYCLDTAYEREKILNPEFLTKSLKIFVKWDIPRSSFFRKLLLFFISLKVK